MLPTLFNVRIFSKAFPSVIVWRFSRKIVSFLIKHANNTNQTFKLATKFKENKTQIRKKKNRNFYDDNEF